MADDFTTDAHDSTDAVAASPAPAPLPAPPAAPTAPAAPAPAAVGAPTPPWPPYAPPPPPRRRAPWIVAVVLALLVAAAVPGAIAFQSQDDGRDPEAALAAGQALVADASSYDFTLDVEDTYQSGSSSITDSYVGEGEWAAGSWRFVLDDGFSVTETILDGETAYERWVDSGEDPSEEMWARWEGITLSRNELVDEVEAMAQDDLISMTSLATLVYLGDVDGSTITSSSVFGGDPAGFLGAVEALAAPRVAEESGDELTLTTTLAAPEEFVEAFGSDVPDARVELDLGADDVPTALRLQAGDDDAEVSVTIEFSNWNGEVGFAPPDEDEIDETPLIGEEALREAASEVALVAPTAVPEDWELTLLDTVDAELAMDTSADSGLDDCTVVEIDWDQDVPLGASDEAWDEAGHLYLWLMTADCALRADQTPFAPGGPGGLPSRENDFYDLLEVQVGDTVVQVDSSLDDAALGLILSTLAPADVEALIDDATAAAEGP